MKFKLMIAVAIMACSVGLVARADMSVKTGVITTTATRAVYTNIVDVPQELFAPTVIGGAPRAAMLYKIVVKNNTLTNASVAVEMEDVADTWTALTGSPVAVTFGEQAMSYPARLVTETIAGYVVTSDVPLAVTSTVTKSTPYWVRRVRLITTLTTATNASTLNWTINYSK